MKKFGTPSGLGPGSEKEKDGLAGVGTPLPLTGGAGLGVVAGFLADGFCCLLCGFFACAGAGALCEGVGFLPGVFVDGFLCGVVVEGEVVVEPGFVRLLG